MTKPIHLHIDHGIARCRVLLSLVAAIAVTIDPTEPLIHRWLDVEVGAFTIDPYLLVILAAHGVYSLILLYAVDREHGLPREWSTISIGADVAFGTMVGLLTEGTTSPLHAFFAFAVLETG